MKKVLLLDTNFSAKPIQDALIYFGFDTWVAGNNPNDSLALSNSNYLKVDYADIEALTLLVKDHKFDHVIPGCNDASYKSAVFINEFLGSINIDNIDNYFAIHNKKEFRSNCIKYNWPSPKVISEFNNSILPHKIILKPTDSFSGKGIRVINKEQIQYIKSAISETIQSSNTRDYVVEEFVEGQLFSHSAFIEKSTVVYDFIVEEHCVANEFAVDTSFVRKDFDGTLHSKLRETIKEMSEILGLKDGLLHTQFLSDGKQIWIIEVTRRCPGDLYSLLIRLSTGYEYARKYVSYFLDLKYESDNNVSGSSRKILRHTISSKVSQDFTGISFNQSVKIPLYVQLMRFGMKIEEAPKSRIGILFIEPDEYFDKALISLLQRSLYTIL